MGGEQSWQVRLRDNLAALERRCGPAVAAAVAETIRELKVTVGSQDPLVATVATDEGEVRLDDRADRAILDKLLSDIKASFDRGDAIFFSGLGNGVFFDTVYRHQPTLYLGMLNPLYVVEEQLEVFAANLMLRDWAEVIAAENVFLFVGPNGLEQFVTFMQMQSCRPLPTQVVTSSTALGQDVAALLEGLGGDRRDRLDRFAEQIGGYYSRIPPERFAQLLSSDPPRRPRVYFITTTFSTVLQYSTRDVADAFEQLGWDTLVDIEPDLAGRNMHLAMAEKIWDFKPDLAFQIDHARFEGWDKLLPAPLPFVTWIQDRMPKLYSTDAGRKLGPTDVVFAVSSGDDLQVNFDYPKAQTFHFPMVVNGRKFSGDPVRDAEAALVFVSHASKPAEALIDDLASFLGSTSPTIREKLVQAGREIIPQAQAEFDEGRLRLFDFQWRELVTAAVRRQGIALAEADHERQLVDFVYMKIGNALFRHQMLAWAAEAGYPLRLYGRGWEDHPTLGHHAAGVLEHGERLGEVSRQTMISLQAVVTCNIHQRVFEGIWAGGFFLLRYHPGDEAATILGGMMDWLDDQRGRAVADVVTDSALSDRERLILRFMEGRWLGKLAVLDDRALDLLKYYAGSGGLVAVLGPAVKDVYFSSRDELIERVRYFADRPDERMKIVRDMQGHLKKWEMTAVLRERLSDVSDYLGTLGAVGSGVGGRLVSAGQ